MIVSTDVLKRREKYQGGFSGECDNRGKYVRAMKSLDVSHEESVAKAFLPVRFLTG